MSGHQDNLSMDIEEFIRTLPNRPQATAVGRPRLLLLDHLGFRTVLQIVNEEVDWKNAGTEGYAGARVFEALDNGLRAIGLHRNMTEEEIAAYERGGAEEPTAPAAEQKPGPDMAADAKQLTNVQRLNQLYMVLYGLRPDAEDYACLRACKEVLRMVREVLDDITRNEQAANQWFELLRGPFPESKAVIVGHPPNTVGFEELGPLYAHIWQQAQMAKASKSA